MIGIFFFVVGMIVAGIGLLLLTAKGITYPVASEMKICYNPRNPEEMRFVGHLFLLPMGLAFLFLGAVLICCCFL